MTEKNVLPTFLPDRLEPSWKSIGVIVSVLISSVKMKSQSKRHMTFEREFHEFLTSEFNGYTVTAGNITGYWTRRGTEEECNEHREYQIAIASTAELEKLRNYLAKLAWRLKERTLFCNIQGRAFLVGATKAK
jgi:hypothetical protein